MKVDIRASSLRFIYPILFDPDEFARRVEAIERVTWPHGQQTLPVWESLAIPVDDLLAYVANFVNPPAPMPATARFWTLGRDALQSASGLGGGSGHPTASWSLVGPRGEYPFRFAEVQLALFQSGVGFVVFAASPTSDQVADWLDFLHFWRFSRAQRQVGLRAERVVGIDPETREPRRVPFFPEPAGGATEQPRGTGTLDRLIHGLLASGEPKASPWWEEVFVPGQLLPSASLFVDDLPPEEIPALLYRVRNFFHSRQEIIPSDEDLHLDHPALLPYVQRQWFTFSLDGGAFLAADAPKTPFFRVNLPEHLAKQYFLLFLLALQQRFTLLRLTQEVARHWLPHGEEDDAARAMWFARIRDALLSFTARGYFAQVMQQEHHHRCYRQWQETFQLSRLYNEVSTEVREMSGYLDSRSRERLEQLTKHQEEQTRRVERRLTLVSWLFGVPSLVFLYLAAIPGAADLGTHFPSALVTFAVGLAAFAFGIGAYRFVGRPVSGHGARPAPRRPST